ncbi:phosphate signaling complex protein PhoU [Liquorilactobacillus mali]|uniref:Phosphate-specific transport system accessory protein PhoU n=1 Tax=Liquorilactobacillus mali KCTC 3596 = DSM 20444 TaxID=1046596 RepID=A0A0R2ECA8_9LACO|nr:phosphate signaling complex protein PhoU [Liquorilactobacillus mali]KRN10076.1 phosphate transport system regulatory protein PhoU [Liquorilactobacillus mali KCTC 3596 = DSM 20444]MDC7953879.1 phosphate signaling complex protein PhoU [Liquorilactobacillus mali]MDV7758020.1 phosphate signaling complex protein PhoU [Liquorilactobacillus mali]QFQ75223.1 phosphate signaling complex protein PhoU [Liquorilactobacillus mali]
MRKILEEQIENLHQDFAKMGFDVAKSIENATNVFENHDEALAKKVLENDSAINESEIYLERKTAQVIALQQPVASDLRVLITILKASSDLERMGDHAVSIVHSTKRIDVNNRNQEIEDILVKMSKHVHKMLLDVIDAYVHNDEEKARSLAADDEVNDDYLRQVRRKALDAMQSDPKFVSAGPEYMVIATHFERMGDYVTNVSEWIVYTNTGRIVELGPTDSKRE